MSYVLGIDPDSKATAWAIVDPHSRQGVAPLSVGVWKTKSAETAGVIRELSVALQSFTGAKSMGYFDLVVVEGQEHHHGRKTPPNDLIRLGQIAGALAGFYSTLCNTIAIPTPTRWKGSVPKDIHQARTFAKLGILSSKAAGYSFPSGCAALSRVQGAASLNKSDWKHVGDALGLALWGAEQLRS